MIELKNGQKILFIGDSITDVKFNRKNNRALKGKRNYCIQTAEALKKKHSGLKFVFRGIASNRSYHLYDRLTQDCIWERPDAVVMLIGVNDAWQAYRPEEYPENASNTFHFGRALEPHMKEIFRRLKTELPEAKLIVLLPFLIDTVEEKKPFHEILDAYRENIRQLAQPTADAILDLQQVFDRAARTIPCKDMATDGVHPTELGHKQIAQVLLEVLK